MYYYFLTWTHRIKETLIVDTTRSREEGEIDGVDYYFVSKQQFETMVSERRFLEHGEYDKEMYGTSTSSIKSILNSAKVSLFQLLLYEKCLQNLGRDEKKLI